MTTWISSTLPGLCLRRCLDSDRSVASRLRRTARSGPGRRRVGRGAWRWAGGNAWWRFYHVPSGLQKLFYSDLIRRQSCKKILTLPTIQLKLAIMIVFTTLITSMRYRVFCLVAMAGDNYKIR